MFSVIEKIPEAIKAGKSIKLQKGDLTIQAGGSTSSPTANDEAPNE